MKRNHQPGFAVWITGLPASGKSTVASALSDPKGIYRRAQQGEAQHVPGLQTRYEPPVNPAVVVRGDQDDPEDAARRIVEVLLNKG